MLVLCLCQENDSGRHSASAAPATRGNHPLVRVTSLPRWWSGNQLEGHAVTRAHHAEVAAVDRGDGAERQAFSHSDDARVDQAQVEIGVRSDQIKSAQRDQSSGTRSIKASSPAAIEETKAASAAAPSREPIIQAASVATGAGTISSSPRRPVRRSAARSCQRSSASAAARSTPVSTTTRPTGLTLRRGGGARRACPQPAHGEAHRDARTGSGRPEWPTPMKPSRRRTGNCASMASIATCSGLM